MYRNLALGKLPGGAQIGVFGDIDSEAPSRAKWNEEGVNNRPERPFLTTTFDANINRYFPMLLPKAGRVGFKWRLDILQGGAQRVARIIAKDVIATIDSTMPPEQSDTQKRYKGHGLTLRDTRVMRASVGYRWKGQIRRDF